MAGLALTAKLLELKARPKTVVRSELSTLGKLHLTLLKSFD